MRTPFRRALMALLLVGAYAAAASAADPAPPTLPALNDPAVDVRLPGKFVWADLFTNDVAKAREFYGGLFGWEWRWVSETPGKEYGMFYFDGRAVAGVAHLVPPKTEGPYARWVYYISVDDVDAAVAKVESGGGRTMLARRDLPSRGSFAVLADPEDAPFGVLNSTSGDPEDFRAEPGEWLWGGHYSHDAKAAADFYSSTFGYEVHARDFDTEVIDYVLSAHGHARAGIAQLRPESESHPTWLGYVRVTDVASVVEQAKSLGAEVIYEPADRLEGDLAVLGDPFGAPIGVMRWTHPATEEPKP